MRTERGQALMEMAVGMFALALVVSVLCLFAVYIARSLEIQNFLRENGKTNSKSDSVAAGSWTAANFTGSETLTIRERIVFPDRMIGR